MFISFRSEMKIPMGNVMIQSWMYKNESETAIAKETSLCDTNERMKNPTETKDVHFHCFLERGGVLIERQNDLFLPPTATPQKHSSNQSKNIDLGISYGMD